MQNLLTVFFMISLSLATSLTRFRFRVTAASPCTFLGISCLRRRASLKENTYGYSNIKRFCSTSSSSSFGNESNTSRQLKRKLVRESANSSTQNVTGTKDQRNVPRHNLSGRRIQDSDRVVSAVPDNKMRAPKPPPKDNFEEFMVAFRVVIRTREYVPAMALYKKMKEINYPLRESVLTGLLSICQKKEHLEYAIQIFTDFLDAGLPLNESAYMSLIRCYSDNGEVDNALRLIEEMNLIEIEPKLRTYHPVLEAVCKNDDFESAMKIIRQMHKRNVVPRSEQLTLLLEVSASSGALENSVTREQVDQLLLSASQDLLGMDTSEMRRVVSAFCKLTPEEVIEEGILIETRDDLPGEILDINSSSSASVVTAMNTTFTDIPILLTDTTTSPLVIDNTVPIGYDYMNSNGGLKRMEHLTYSC
jgi:pentatricopeptide repeat protein